MKLIENICYTKLGHPSQLLDAYIPDKESFPGFIYFHGGGIEAGDKRRGLEKCFEQLADNGIAVVSANYRMYPEARYPEFLCDAAACVAWAMKNMKAYGNCEGIFVGGSSAGGYMSQMLCFDKKYLSVHKIDSDSITGYIHDAGQPTAHFNVLRERGIDSRRIIVDESAPLYHIVEGRNYPPMQIIYSEFDIENRAEQTKLLVSTMKHFGCDMSKVDLRYMEGYKHCKYLSSFDENGSNVFCKMVTEFIAKYNVK